MRHVALLAALAAGCGSGPAPSCGDRMLNGVESDVDCGGGCPPCANSLACRSASDCRSQLCSAGFCTDPGGKMLAFDGARAIALGYSPLRLVAGDFDGDGRRDLVSLPSGGYLVELARGLGADGFADAVAFPAALGTFAVAADLDGDGSDDLVVSDLEDTAVTVLLSRAGGFLPSVAYDAGAPPAGLAVADLDEDHVADLLVETPTALVVFPGAGGGAFGPPSSFGWSAAHGRIVARDFDRDGHLDVLLGDEAGLQLALGNGPGGLRGPPVPIFNDGKSVFDLVVADFNDDGFPDLACAEAVSVVVRFGAGDGLFPRATTLSSPFGSTFALGAGDFDRDHRLDLVLAPALGITFAVVPGDADGTFRSPALVKGADPATGGLAVDDFDGDGAPDLAFGDASVGRIIVLYDRAR
jgi:hypothetical protein